MQVRIYFITEMRVSKLLHFYLDDINQQSWPDIKTMKRHN